MHLIRLHLCLITVVIGSSVQAADLYSKKYDQKFEKYSEMYMPGRSWKLLKAQCFQESRFDENAISPVGAAGLCQFMPATWSEQERNLKLRGSSFDPVLNIQFASYYMSKLRNVWRARRPIHDKESLSIASYNAGTGNILKAQKRCDNRSLWSEISPCLKDVTGNNNSKETLTYVDRIWKYYKLLGGSI